MSFEALSVLLERLTSPIQNRAWGRKGTKSVYEDRTAMSSLSLVVAREILQRMEETPMLARLARDSMTMQVSALARDSLKLGLMAYMGECLDFLDGQAL